MGLAEEFKSMNEAMKITGRRNRGWNMTCFQTMEWETRKEMQVFWFDMR